MAILQNSNVVVGIAGGIAAYKSAMLVRLLRAAGVNVRVVMTASAQSFIGPLSLQALSGHPVACDLLDESAEAGMGHIELARWADHLVVAPATANLLARLYAGMADDLLTTLVLATQAKIWLAPAMNQHMWSAAATARNVDGLKSLYPDWQWLGPAAGEQACGDLGVGRMLEPAAIFDALQSDSLNSETDLPLFGRRIVLTSGPTHEPIDPVRYISNHSSGKMGAALAQAFLALGAEVTIISGPVQIQYPAQAKLICVITALEMQAAVDEVVADCDLFIGVAAVADYRLAAPSKNKIKKQGHDSGLQLNLVANPDILASVAAHANRPKLVVGFAAETDQLLANARKKLQSKGLDYILANEVGLPRQGMNSDDNALVLIGPELQHSFPLASKAHLAEQVAQWLGRQLVQET